MHNNGRGGDSKGKQVEKNKKIIALLETQVYKL